MESILDHIIGEDIALLDKQQTVETLFYTTQLLKRELNPLKLTRYRMLEADLQKRVEAFRRSKRYGFYQ